LDFRATRRVPGRSGRRGERRPRCSTRLAQPRRNLAASPPRRNLATSEVQTPPRTHRRPAGQAPWNL